MMSKVREALSKLFGYVVMGAFGAAGIIFSSVTYVGLLQAWKIHEIQGLTYIDEKLTDTYYGEQGDPAKYKQSGILKLLTEDDDGFCTAFVIDKNYAMTARHCLVDEETFGLSKEIIHIQGPDSKPTKIIARAAAISPDPRRDFGLVRGDFSEFAPFKLDLTGQLTRKSQGPYISCGFPEGQKQLVCTPVRLLKYASLDILGYGQLFPGQSGGPLIDYTTGTVVGINAAASDEGLWFTELVGSMASFEIEEP